MSISAVVFDIGNVLVEWHPVRFYDGEIGVERSRRLFAEVPLEDMNLAVDMGADFASSVEALADAHPGWRGEILMWRDRWLEMASPDIPHSAALLRSLRAKGIPVHALSNFGVATFEIAREAYPVLAEFDRAFISGEWRMAKPDPAFYEVLERETGADPRGLLFADDRAENLRAAESRGWRTHLFADPRGWADRLVAERLLTPEEAAA